MSVATWQYRSRLSWRLRAAVGYFWAVMKPRNLDRILRTRWPSISPQSASPALSRAVTARCLGPLKGNLMTITPGYGQSLPDSGFCLVQVIQDRLVVSGKPIRDNLVQEWDHQPTLTILADPVLFVNWPVLLSRKTSLSFCDRIKLKCQDAL